MSGSEQRPKPSGDKVVRGETKKPETASKPPPPPPPPPKK